MDMAVVMDRNILMDRVQRANEGYRMLSAVCPRYAPSCA